MKDMSHTIVISAVPAEVLDVVWPDAAPLLEQAVETSGGRYSMERLWEELQERKLGLWVALEGTTPIAAITTRIAVYPDCKALAMDWIGGTRMEEWLPVAHEILGRYGREHGCSHLEGYGRKGWERALRKFGWVPDLITYRMDLTDG